MPLVRKPSPPAAIVEPTTRDVWRALESPRPDERWAAARAATELAEGCAALVAALGREQDARVREAMFTSLSRIPTGESAAALTSFLRSDDAQLRSGALRSLGAMVAIMADLLPALLEDADVDVRILSCELARQVPGPDANRLLSALLLREEDVNVCAAAIDVLAEVGTPASLPSLEACADRFPEAPFLRFSLDIAVNRICSQVPESRD